MTDDPFAFLYDRAIRDENGVDVHVTLVDADADAVQINIESGSIRIPFFLSITNATELARLLVNAVAAYDRATEAKTTAE